MRSGAALRDNKWAIVAFEINGFSPHPPRHHTTPLFLDTGQFTRSGASAESIRQPHWRGLAWQTENTMNAHDDPNEPVPWMQQLLDNPFLLLFLGVLIPMVVYTLWGVIDILTVPLAK